MSILHLPPELLTIIFSFVDPPSLFNLCLTSSTSHQVIIRHASTLTHSIATRHSLSQYPYAPSPSPLQSLLLRHHRHHLNTLLCSKVKPADLGWRGDHADLVPAFRYGLDILWTYHDAMNTNDKAEIAGEEDRLRKWVDRTSLEKIDYMSMHVNMYAGMLMRLAPGYRCGGLEPGPARELALGMGVGFLVRALVEDDEEARGVVGRGYEEEEGEEGKLKVGMLARERGRKVEGVERALGVRMR